jgi:hypothetical protein
MYSPIRFNPWMIVEWSDFPNMMAMSNMVIRKYLSEYSKSAIIIRAST